MVGLQFVGTSSGAGKSLFVLALCRILSDEGYKVCPFKAQNMSLQSYITLDGGEIGFAQALQAKACRIEPRVEFNPILLKASAEKGSQVILMGKVFDTLPPQKYYQKKDVLWEVVTQALERLKKDYQVVVVEGAGSPAEINLLEGDIVNLRIAHYLNIPAILIGDIDKGGVFASLWGTKELLNIYKPEWSRCLKGFVINKFRGDVDILAPGIKELERLSNLKCFGVVPYFNWLCLGQEDGASLPVKKEFHHFKRADTVKIVVLRLPYIANFWDFDPFLIEQDVHLIYSLDPEDILSADVVFIPGSKNTVKDLQFLKSLELDEIIKEALKRGSKVVGICGGFQMLGEVIRDPFGVESQNLEERGLGLLEVETEFLPEKVTSQVIASSLRGNFDSLWGYELHMGISRGDLNLFKIKRIATGEELLEGSYKDGVWGTYLHGIFTNDEFRRSFLNECREKKGLAPIKEVISYNAFVDEQINSLAQAIKRHLDIGKICSLIGI